jgi:mRNA interferase RelE/StbE
MAWYRLMFHTGVAEDLSCIGAPMAQRLFEKTKWIASNVENLRHESLPGNLAPLHKYAVGDWRIFYVIDRAEQLVSIQAIVHRKALFR